MITVYRIEAADGIGPYWNTDWSNRPAWMNAHNNSDNHPAPRVDLNGKFYQGQYLFGCTSLAALNEWFGPETREWLREKGHAIREYEVDEYTLLTGRYQCAFKQDTAIKGKVTEI